MEEEKKHALFFADSRLLGSFLHGDSVDLILSGPPYFNEVVYSQEPGQLSAQSDYRSFLAGIGEVWKACRTVLKPGGIIGLWVHDFYGPGASGAYIPFHADLLATLQPHFELKNIVVWDRYLKRHKGPLPASRPLGTRLEYILILQKGGDRTENKENTERALEHWFWQPVWDEKTVPRLLGSNLLFRFAHFLTKKLPSLDPIRRLVNESRLISDKHAFALYPTECPPEVARRLISDFSQPGDTVLDPFLGSGTTMKVADELGRKCIGVEIHKGALYAIEQKVGKGKFRIVTN